MGSAAFPTLTRKTRPGQVRNSAHLSAGGCRRDGKSFDRQDQDQTLQAPPGIVLRYAAGILRLNI